MGYTYVAIPAHCTHSSAAPILLCARALQRPTGSPSPHSSAPCSNDVSLPGGPGELVGFIAGDAALALIEGGAAQLEAKVTHKWAQLWGSRGIATEALNVVVADWMSEPWTGGAYSAYMRPGAWVAFGEALAKPVGRIHWAGAEVSPRWPCYFEGAVEAAEVAVAAIKPLLPELGSGAQLKSSCGLPAA